MELRDNAWIINVVLVHDEMYFVKYKVNLT